MPDEPKRCGTCHRPLKDPASRKRGYGPICFRKKHGKPARSRKAGGAVHVAAGQSELDRPITGFPDLPRR